MNRYQNRIKGRKIKKQIKNLIKTFTFRSFRITNGEKLMLFGTLLVFVSLFLPWVNSVQGSIQENSFSNLAGRSGVIMLTISILLFFIIFSKRKKEKLKMIGNLHFRNYLLGIMGGLFISISSLSSLSYISGLQIFSSDIIYGQGPIIALVGGIIIITGSIMLRNEENSGIENIFTEEKNENKNKTNKRQRDNMKLPF